MGFYVEPYPGNEFFKSFTKTWHTKPYAQIAPDRPELSVAGKTVFVTGGGTGIGKATAIAFAQARAKAIAIFGRRVERLTLAADEIRKANPAGTTHVVFEGVDLSKRGAVEIAFTSALRQVAEGGESTKIDVFVSNAGMLPQVGTVAGYSEADFYKGLEMNFGSAFNTIQAMMPLLTTDATVLNISSGIAHIDPFPNLWLYATTKLANTKMFDYLQSENPNLRIINVQPGVVTSELNSGSGYTGQDDVELPGQFHLWLASPEADFLKGKFVWVNWDVDELKARADEIKDSHLLKVLLNGVPM
ncbi:hypothetical protein PV08_02236 [Exophiala spinifera]|uniref:Uncharacterized protein n=1 Tax=Exophiala spinifera TaxID=91928 RepID=A0A0D1Z1W9_9EURO|nr:uncharacterized protein PV08_02236 [Exophiala spinifera]KIW21656.1 hypothetical protein PV08_02236 [Exophiala spinifera]